MTAQHGHALDGVRVLDFSRVLAGPMLTMVLADLGADVIKVERPVTGDDTRAWGPPYDANGDGIYFQSVNRGKRSVCLDLAIPEHVAHARTLALEADVLVENFRTGVMDRLGLGCEQLRADNERLIYCSITGFGRHGGSAMPGYDLLVQAVGGLMSITGHPDGPPQKVGVALVDILTGLFAGVGVLAALRHCERTGRGQRVEVDLLSALLAALTNCSTSYTVAGVVQGRMGNRHPSIAPYEPVPTRNGEVVLAVGNDRQFMALCDVLGMPELAADERFSTNSQRVAHRQALFARLRDELADRDAEEISAALLARGVPAGAVNDIAGAFALAERLGLQPVIQVPRGDGTSVSLPRNPIRMSETPPVYQSAPPSLPREVGTVTSWDLRGAPSPLAEDS